MKEFLDNNKKYMEKPVRKSKKGVANADAEKPVAEKPIVEEAKADGEKPVVKKVKKII